MHIDFFLSQFKKTLDNDAIIWNDTHYSYNWLVEHIEKWSKKLKSNGINASSVVAIDGIFSPNTVAMLFALVEMQCIIIPLYKINIKKSNELFDICMIDFFIVIRKNVKIKSIKSNKKKYNKFYDCLKKQKHPGLVLLSSGSSGRPKAAVHDFISLLEKFKTKRNSLRTINFLQFDHWGGLNTMFHTLANLGVLVFTENRTPEHLCKLTEEFGIELWPVSPTFLNLLLISESYKKFNLQSLKIISYGSEPMNEYILKKCNKIFPNVKLHQTYGLIEVGVLHSKSERNDSLWVKMGGDGYKTRIVDNILQIKSNSTMLGYLNAKSPFTDDGWFNTEDEVEVKGDYFRILGRKSEIINVGGEKVYPIEIENIIQELEEIIEVTVFGEKNHLIGSIVCAKIRVNHKTNKKEIIQKIKNHCRENMERYKVPVKIIIDDKIQYSNRFKKERIIS